MALDAKRIAEAETELVTSMSAKRHMMLTAHGLRKS
jgi:hypothetical protein